MAPQNCAGQHGSRHPPTHDLLIPETLKPAPATAKCTCRKVLAKSCLIHSTIWSLQVPPPTIPDSSTCAHLTRGDIATTATRCLPSPVSGLPFDLDFGGSGHRYLYQPPR